MPEQYKLEADNNILSLAPRCLHLLFVSVRLKLYYQSTRLLLVLIWYSFRAK